MIITEYALKFRTTVYVLLVFICIAGSAAYSGLPLEAAPEVKIPIILVHTVYPGVAPADMEKLVTNVLERQLKDLKDVKKMTSASAESVSLVNVEFETGVDLDDAYQKIRDKVDMAKADLPVDANDPRLIEINISEFPIMLVTVSGDYGLDRVKSVGEDIQDQIEQIPGVLGVDITGGLEREIQIRLDPARLEYYALSVNQVVDRIRQEHLTTPAGNIELGSSKYAVRIPGEYKDVSRMEDIIVKADNGNPIKLRDLGRVVDYFKDRETVSRLDGTECVTLRIKKRAGANIVEIADEIKTLLPRIEPTLPAGTQISISQDNSAFVRDRVADLNNTIITGLLLVIGVLFFAMGLRNAFFVAIAIPLSMLISFLVLQGLGVTLNIVVLFALVLALGMLVDNSIVVVDNIYRHVSEGSSRARAAYEATKEVAWPIIASTATTVLVFVPLMFWPGIMGDFMWYMPVTVIAVLVSSLFVALVINPVIAADFLRAGDKKLFDDSGEVSGPILRRYKALLEWCLDRPKTMVLASNALLILVIVIYGVLGAGVEFFPRTTPDFAQVSVTAPQGTALEKTDGLLRKVEEIAKAEDNTESIIANVGFDANSFVVIGGGGKTHSGVVDVDFLDRHDRTHTPWDTVENIRKQLGDLAGAEYSIKVEEGGPPTGDPVVVEVSGPEFKQLEEYSREVKNLIATIDGVVDIKDDFEPGKPEIRIEVDRDQAMLRKVNTAMVAGAVRAAVNGIEASVLREKDEEYDITVRYDAPFRDSIDDIRDIRVLGKDDVQIPLRDVANVTTAAGLGSINHIDQARAIQVSSDVTGRSSSEIMIDVARVLSEKLEPKLKSGYRLHYGGESEEQDEAGRFLMKAFMIGIMLMFLLLITQFNSVLRPAVILGSVVMALIGVLIGLLLTRDKFGFIMTGMGIISLAGVVVNNAIVLIDYTDQLKDKFGLKLRDALVRAGVVRFRPVLLTAITTVLGLLPMATGVNIDFTTMSIDMGGQSAEMWGPMARPVAFGLLFATALTLIMVPVMYLLQDNAKVWVLRTVHSMFGGGTKPPKRAPEVPED